MMNDPQRPEEYGSYQPGQPPYQQQPYQPYQLQYQQVPGVQEHPSEVMAIAIMAIVDAVISGLAGLGWIVTICGIPLGIYNYRSGGGRYVCLQAAESSAPAATAEQDSGDYANRQYYHR